MPCNSWWFTFQRSNVPNGQPRINESSSKVTWLGVHTNGRCKSGMSIVAPLDALALSRSSYSRSESGLYTFPMADSRLTKNSFLWFSIFFAVGFPKDEICSSCRSEHNREAFLRLTIFWRALLPFCFCRGRVRLLRTSDAANSSLARTGLFRGKLRGGAAA